MNDHWFDSFFRRCQAEAASSKDPTTKVGAVIVDDDKGALSSGFNGFPRGIADTPERLASRHLKNRLVVHAERNAILNVARTGGAALRGATICVEAIPTDGSEHWGAPCVACALEIIQAGIKRVITRPIAAAPERWHGEAEEARLLLEEAGVEYVEIVDRPVEEE